MKFNLNTRTSKERGNSDFIRALLQKFITEFCEEYDINNSNKASDNLRDYHGNLPMLIQWANSRGWSITTWELRNSNDNTQYAYGLDFANDCPLFMEARLKYS